MIASLLQSLHGVIIAVGIILAGLWGVYTIRRCGLPRPRRGGDWTMAEIRGFLRAGGMFSTAEWHDMTPEVRDAVEAAATALDLERTIGLASMIQSPEAIRSALVPPPETDAGEEFLVRSAMERVAQASLKRMRESGGL